MQKKPCNRFSNALIILILFLGLSFDSAYSQTDAATDWSFLSTTTIGAKQFIQAHPEYDGRGIVIFILDSGVDMSVPGLTETSDGKAKIIDVRDFSGQGDIMLYMGDLGEEDKEKFIKHPDGFLLYNYHHLDKKPTNNEYFIGYIDEDRFMNSDVKDINNNGKYDDVFGILAFEVEEQDTLYWVTYVDTDGDQHIDDEKAIRDYRVNYDTFQLRGGDKKYDRHLMTFALNILPEEMKVSLHFDDSGHGTHVAGIAAGYKINNQNGFNGIAPGAQIISLKIGNGSYEGSCTVTGSLRKALNFVEDYVKQHKIPAVVNISYGIGSIREGRSDIEHIVSDVLTFNENIFICVSNGNEGPGLSTTGTPAAAKSAFSVGAMLAADVANECYGANLKEDKIFYFSARGGELNKPDAIAPGSASSTIPTFTDDDFMRGSSMAAPQAAGAAALVLSAALQMNPPLITKNSFIYCALKYSAIPIKNYSYIDQGCGVINVPKAFQFLKSHTEIYRGEKVVTYEISTEYPSTGDVFIPSAYWRAGGYFPGENEQQTFIIRAVFRDSLDADTRANFYRAFELKSADPWLYPVTKSTYIKGEKPATVDVKYSSAHITKPGLYCAKIIGYRKEQGIPRYDPRSIEFELLNTIIVPYIFDHQNKYQQQFQNRSISPGDVDRYFILVPTGATTAKITIAPGKNKFCHVNCFGYSPKGIKYFTLPPVTDREQNQESQVIPSHELSPGIWEIDVYADFQNEKASVYDLVINFSSFKVEPPSILEFNHKVGREPNGYLKVTNQFNVPFYGFGRGKLYGYQRKLEKVVRDRDIFNYDFRVEPDIKTIEFEIDFDDDSFLQFTDVAINVYDTRGRALFKDALNQDKSRIVLERISEGDYSLEIVVAFAYSSYDALWQFDFTEKYYSREEIDIKIYEGIDRLFKLYPFVSRDFEFTLNNSPRIPPDGFQIFGTIEFIDRNLLQQVFTVPVWFR
ncbi:MAG: S8 family serine peptidase [bacterium]|nr:MAG: S8 family serine peptidase [bacterium]